METQPGWILTDRLGQTPTGGASWIRWTRGATHTIWPASMGGYACDSVHLPFLLDPLYERYGNGARLWRSEASDPKFEDSVRLVASVWTTLEEWERPAWVGTDRDMRVRLRFAILAAAGTHPSAEVAERLRGLSLEDIPAAARLVEQVCADRRHGPIPQSTSLAAMAIRSAAALVQGTLQPMDLIARNFRLYAWYAAMAATCSGADLQKAADEAVRREGRKAPIQNLIGVAAAV